MNYVSQPQGRWNALKSAVAADYQPEITIDALFGDDNELQIIKDTTLTNYLTLLPPTFKPSNLSPSYEVVDGPAGERKEELLKELTSAYAKRVNLSTKLELMIQDAAIYGVSYLYVAEDDVIWLKHDSVEFTNTWLQPGKVCIHYEDVPSNYKNIHIKQEDKERNLIALKMIFDEADKRASIEYDGTEVDSFEYEVLPIVRLEYGDYSDSAEYPLGLIYPALSLIVELNLCKSELYRNVETINRQPILVPKAAWGEANRGAAAEWYGKLIIPVDEEIFFTADGQPRVFQLPVAALPNEFYKKESDLRNEIDSVLHISDITRMQGLRSGATATEVAALEGAQTRWVTIQRNKVVEALISLWRIWSTYKSIDPNKVTIVIPDIDPSDPQARRAEAAFLLNLLKDPLMVEALGNEGKAALQQKLLQLLNLSQYYKPPEPIVEAPEGPAPEGKVDPSALEALQIELQKRSSAPAEV